MEVTNTSSINDFNIYNNLYSLYYIDFLEITILEKKAFEICDEDHDNGLSWDEVEKCEASIYVSNIKYLDL